MSIQNIKTNVEISKLMDNYTDEEFLIEGSSNVSTKAVAKMVMNRVKDKRRVLRPRVLLVAAALALTSVVFVAAVLPYGFLQSPTGMEYEFYDYGMEMKLPGVELDSERVELYTKEGDRIYFTANGENIDITDYFERGESYYYKYRDTDNRGDSYDVVLAVGGKAEDPACAEMVFILKEGVTRGFGGATFYNSAVPYCYYKDGEVVIVETPEQREECSKYPWRNIEYPVSEEFYNQWRLWGEEVRNGNEIDVNNVDRSVTYKSRYTEWLYPEGWTGERISNDIPELPELAD